MSISPSKNVLTALFLPQELEGRATLRGWRQGGIGTACSSCSESERGSLHGAGRRWRKIKRDKINIRSLNTDPTGAGNSPPSVYWGRRQARAPRWGRETRTRGFSSDKGMSHLPRDPPLDEVQCPSCLRVGRVLAGRTFQTLPGAAGTRTMRIFFLVLVRFSNRFKRASPRTTCIWHVPQNCAHGFDSVFGFAEPSSWACQHNNQLWSLPASMVWDGWP